MENNYIFHCKECSDTFNGETDCLKHADKYGHLSFIDPEGDTYEPFKDHELMGGDD